MLCSRSALSEIAGFAPNLLVLETRLDKRRGGRLVRGSFIEQQRPVRTAELQPFIIKRAATPGTSLHHNTPTYKPIVKLDTVCVNQRDEIVIRGEATVLVS